METNSEESINPSFQVADREISEEKIDKEKNSNDRRNERVMKNPKKNDRDSFDMEFEENFKQPPQKQMSLSVNQIDTVKRGLNINSQRTYKNNGLSMSMTSKPGKFHAGVSTEYWLPEHSHRVNKKKKDYYTDGNVKENNNIDYAEKDKDELTALTSRDKRNTYNNQFINIFYVMILLIELLLITLMGIFYKFPDMIKSNEGYISGESLSLDSITYAHYSLDLFHVFFNSFLVLFLLGIGLLHAYLKSYTWTSVGLQLFVGLFNIQLGLIFIFLWEIVFQTSDVPRPTKRNLTFTSLLKAGFNSLTTMISINSVLGNLTIPQYLFLSIFESFFSSFNYALNIVKMQVVDDGGSLYVYCFGGFFGVATSIAFNAGRNDKITKSKRHLGASEKSALIGIIGTILIIIFMPSLNVALTPLTSYDDHNKEISIISSLRYRGIFNTFFSIIGSVIASFILTGIMNKGKLKMSIILNSSISGGVIAAGYGTFNNYPYISAFIGVFAGILTTFSLIKISPFFERKNINDTMGGWAVFGLMGLLGGLLGGVFMSCINEDDFNTIKNYIFFKDDASDQAGYQIASVFITFSIAVITGLLTGAILKVLKCLGNLNRYYVDRENFEEESEPFHEFKRILSRPPTFVAKKFNTEIKPYREKGIRDE